MIIDPLLLTLIGFFAVIIIVLIALIVVPLIIIRNNNQLKKSPWIESQYGRSHEDIIEDLNTRIEALENDQSKS